MRNLFPVACTYMKKIIDLGYRIQIYQDPNGKYTCSATHKDKPTIRWGCSFDDLTDRMLTATLIKIQNKIEEPHGN